MNALTILFTASLLSFAIRSKTLLKLFALLALAIAGYYAGNGIILHGFESSSAVVLFEQIVFIVLGALIIYENEALTIVQALFLATASLLLLESNTLLSFLFSFEAVSIISFVLVSHIKNATQAEGAVKMFIAGAIATVFIVLGVTLYTLEGHDINATIAADLGTFATAGIWIMMIGLFYKITIVPMHSWAADSYALIRPSHAALLSGVAKTVVVVAVFKMMAPFLMQHITFNAPVIFAFAIITMTLGNFLALFQTNIAKIFAYSSIAHAGYMLMVFGALESKFAFNGLLYLAIAYIFMQSAVFALLHVINNGASTLKLEQISGLSKRDPKAAFFLSVQLFSLAGIPLLAGFLAKAVAVYAVVDAGYWIVALIALLNSALSVGYYAWIIKHLYFDQPKGKIVMTQKIGGTVTLSQMILLGGTFYFGIVAVKIFSVHF